MRHARVARSRNHAPRHRAACRRSRRDTRGVASSRPALADRTRDRTRSRRPARVAHDAAREIPVAAQCARGGRRASRHVRVVARARRRRAGTGARPCRPRPRRRPPAALQRSAPFRLPALAAGGHDARTAARSRPRTPGRRLRRRLPVRAKSRPQRAGEGFPDGPAHRRRRRQHLRRRSPVRRRRAADARDLAELADAIRRILAYAIERGGTTLRDFLKPDGEPGYFEQELFVYGRDGEPCKRCGTAITARRDAQRASFYCRVCQR